MSNVSLGGNKITLWRQQHTAPSHRLLVYVCGRMMLLWRGVLISWKVKKIISQQVCILQVTQCADTLLSSLRGAVQINSSALPSRTSVRKSPASTTRCATAPATDLVGPCQSLFLGSAGGKTCVLGYSRPCLAGQYHLRWWHPNETQHSRWIQTGDIQRVLAMRFVDLWDGRHWGALGPMQWSCVHLSS